MILSGHCVNNLSKAFVQSAVARFAFQRRFKSDELEMDSPNIVFPDSDSIPCIVTLPISHWFHPNCQGQALKI
jgi:hypothetical protein